MTQIKIKRVYESYSEDDGFRVLVDKLWPRGIKKELLKLDLWEKDIAPSTDLRKWFHEDPDGRWDEFEKRYLLELSLNESINIFITKVKEHHLATLLYASKDIEHNHAIILKSYIDNLIE